MSERAEFIAGLRALADFYEAHDELIVPIDARIDVGNVFDNAEHAAAMARLLAPCLKEHAGSTLSLVKSFGPLPLRLIYWRESVCTKRVVGKETVAAVPEHEIEIVEWDCAPILRPAHD